LKYFGQVIFYALFAIGIGYFSVRPLYTYSNPDMAMIKLSFSHTGAHVSECRRFTQEELNALAPNMRRPADCPRERVPLLVELELDGAVIYRDELQPDGLAKDGSATAYKGFTVTPGRHEIKVRMRDSRRTDGFDWQYEKQVNLSPRENLAIDFHPGTGGFIIL
jgi:hypothetical protein